MFSIVIPNYNQSRYLATALESLKHQKAPFSLALMDGGSTDGFAEVITPYADIIDVMKTGPDAGQTAAIREGLNRVPGRIVTWLNADDYYFPNILEKVADVFQRKPEVDVVYGEAVHVTADGDFLSYSPIMPDFDPGHLPRNCCVCQPACFVRRSAYDRAGGLDPNLSYTMDWDLWCRLGASGARFAYLPEPLAAVRYYPETKTLSGDRKRYMEIWRIERIYGKRYLPFSWPEFYFYDLKHLFGKTLGQKAIFWIFRQMSGLRGRIFPDRPEAGILQYGFWRGSDRVNGKCTIRIPWYAVGQKERYILVADPADDTYEVRIGDNRRLFVPEKKGRMEIEIPATKDRKRTMSVENIGGNPWRLVSFKGRVCDETP